MAFSQATIVQVYPPIVLGGDLYLSWESTSPAGTWFQVYIDQVLAWHGTTQYCVLPAPTEQIHIDVGTVGPGEQFTNFASSLPSTPANRALLAWEGGSFLDPSGNGDVAGFKVFGSPSPGAAVDYSTPLATIPCYTGPGNTAGYGMGGYGQGGYGQAGASYSWESGPLWSGTWTFAVAAYDREGDLGATAAASYTFSVPPRQPGWGEAEPRLTYSLNGYGSGGYGGGGYGEPTITLTWLASPG